MPWKIENARRFMTVGATAVVIGLVTRVAEAFQGQGASEFVPMDQLNQQQNLVPGGTLVVAAYAFAWVAVTVYLFTLWRRASRIDRELADVRAQLANRAHRAG